MLHLKNDKSYCEEESHHTIWTRFPDFIRSDDKSPCYFSIYCIRLHREQRRLFKHYMGHTLKEATEESHLTIQKNFNSNL